MKSFLKDFLGRDWEDWGDFVGFSMEGRNSMERGFFRKVFRKDLGKGAGEGGLAFNINFVAFNINFVAFNIKTACLIYE